MTTSSSVWAGVLACKAGDGAAAAACNAQGESVAVRVTGRTEGKLALQLIRREGFQVLMEATDVRQLAEVLEEGPKIRTWDEFRCRGSWGDEGVGIQEGRVSRVVVEFKGWGDLTGAFRGGPVTPAGGDAVRSGGNAGLGVWGCRARWRAPGRYPGRGVGRRAKLSWASATWSCCGRGRCWKLHETVSDRSKGRCLRRRGAGRRWRRRPRWGSSSGRGCFGSYWRRLHFTWWALRRLPGEEARGSRQGSPTRRARRSATAASRGSILAGALAAAVAEQPSPQQSPAKRQRSITIEELSQLTPTSLLEAAKKLCREQHGTQEAAPLASGGATSREVRRGSVAAASDGAHGMAAIPFPPLPFDFPRAAVGVGVTPQGRGSAAGAQPRAGCSPLRGDPGGAAMDLRSANADNNGSLRPFFPPAEGGIDVVQWVVRLAEAGFPGPPAHIIMHVSGASGVGFQPDLGSSLEAELLVANVTALVDDLLARGALPARLVGTPPQADCGRRCGTPGRCSARTPQYSIRRGDVGCSGAGVTAEAGPSVDRSKEKPPADSFEAVEAASKAVDKQLAVPADMALRVEHMRDSAFKDLVTATKEERECQLDGVRGHLERRALGWVESVFGKERAADAQYVVEAQKLGVSVMTGVVPGDSVEGAESVIVRLLGGSKPNEMAGICAEGGARSQRAP
ncbi:MAG: hypothetical protein SGPRY_002003 [Prymnesium sp.]